jgi:HTH-type transcriptional regulator/antitoxin HigA
MKIKVIKTGSEYAAALARVEKLMDAKPGTSSGDELEILSLLIHDYEERVFPIAKPDPVAAIRFRMTQQGLTNNDLVPFLGSRSRVSEILSGRRSLSLKMIRALVGGLRIPADVLLGENSPNEFAL